VKAVQATFPTNSIGVVISIGRASEDLKKHADFHAHTGAGNAIRSRCGLSRCCDWRRLQ
jgi:hypothetical protein